MDDWDKFALSLTLIGLGIIFCALFHTIGVDMGRADIGKMVCEEEGEMEYVGAECGPVSCTVKCEKKNIKRYDGGFIEIQGGG